MRRWPAAVGALALALGTAAVRAVGQATCVTLRGFDSPDGPGHAFAQVSCYDHRPVAMLALHLVAVVVAAGVWMGARRWRAWIAAAARRRWPIGAGLATLVVGTAGAALAGLATCARYCAVPIAGGTGPGVGCVAVSCYRLHPWAFAALHAGVVAVATGSWLACRRYRRRRRPPSRSVR